MEIAKAIIALGDLIVWLALGAAIFRKTVPTETWEWRVFWVGFLIMGVGAIAKWAILAIRWSA